MLSANSNDNTCGYDFAAFSYRHLASGFRNLKRCQMKYIIADLIVEMDPKYENTKKLAAPFAYHGDREADIKLKVSEEYLANLMKKMVEGTDAGQTENFALGTDFNRKAIRFGTMLVHSSALICDGGAYLFSADSGVGKSYHTRLWLKKFGDRVHIMNDDKPVVRLYDSGAVAYGTPFDGGSGIALNESFPLKAIIFIERGEHNSVRVPQNREVIQKLYFQTAHMVNAETADKMLGNFEKLLSLTRFYVLTCNMEDEAAEVAYQCLINTL